MLTEISPPSAGQTILDEMARHMRLSSSFAASESADVADAYVAAVSHLEARLGLCLAPRAFRWRTCFGGDARAPIGPIRSLISAIAIAPGGGGEVLPLSRFYLSQSETRTMICGSALFGREVEFEFEAGFGADWSETPADLRRAALMLSAHYFDHRHAAGDRLRETPLGVTALVRPWAPTRLSLGGAA